MPNVELPSGASAVLRGPETVRNRERRLAARATDAVPGLAAKDIVAVDSLISQLLVSWTLPSSLPSEAEDPSGVFDEMEIPDYNVLRDAAMKVYAEARGIDAEPSKDPDSPTKPLGD